MSYENLLMKNPYGFINIILNFHKKIKFNIFGLLIRLQNHYKPKQMIINKCE